MNQLFEENPHITEDLLRKVYKHQKAKFIQFLKHILGIEILEQFDEIVQKEIQAFITKHNNLTTLQIEFLELLKSFIIEKGTIRKKDLVQAPFTVIHPKGIIGIFPRGVIKEIVDLTKKLAA